MLKVCKFGGSSVSSAENFKKVKSIVESDSTRGVVITSAIGKEKSDDSKITDLLYLLHAHIKYKVNYDHLLDSIKERFYRVKNSLGLSLDLDAEFEYIEENMKKLGEDYLVSRGEYLTALMLSEYLGYEFVDAKDVMIFNYDGKVNMEESIQRIKMATINKKVVMPGFYGSYPNGDIKLFSRGGSDISGAIAARAVDAVEYENFTDVDGFYISSPQIVSNPRLINEITYQELRELSYMGASVIHEDTLFPIEEVNIPLHIKNTFNPYSKGTIISNDVKDNSSVVTGITGKKGFMAIEIVKSKASNKIDVIAYALKILKKYNAVVESIPTSIDSFSIVVDKTSVEKKIYDIISELKENESVIDVDKDDDLSLVSVVGRNMATKPGVSAKIFSCLGSNEINIKLISQNTSEISITVGVSSKDYEKSINSIYNAML